MENEAMIGHPSKQRAIDIALWMTFKYRIENRIYGVEQNRKTKEYHIVELENRRRKKLLDFPMDYSQMHYNQISSVLMDKNPLSHWEEIRGMLSTTDGEVLRFMLKYKIPLEKLIRFELASRGYDENEQWVGFERAYEGWLK